MAMTRCDDCGREISDKALACPGCGAAAPNAMQLLEYRSKRTLCGLPLVHVVWGPSLDWRTGRVRAAKGIIAVGPVAVGVLAVGGLAFGAVSFGGLALGLAAVGGMAVALGLAVGGMALGLVAVGGCAVGYYAIGGGAFGVHVLSGARQDAVLLDFFKRLSGG
ncbi:MAG TPA: zinc ribbon domain-containing protein [Phycisphaerales bacterium]|nr:zinc ribbon domain-containing protein [Phycisphaerales bacterium]